MKSQGPAPSANKKTIGAESGAPVSDIHTPIHCDTLSSVCQDPMGWKYIIDELYAYFQSIVPISAVKGFNYCSIAYATIPHLLIKLLLLLPQLLLLLP